MVRRRLYFKYHIIATLDHLLILRARITSYRYADSPILRSLKGILVEWLGRVPR